MIDNQFQTKISILRSDNATEYFNKYFRIFLTEKGVIHQSTCDNTPQQNGIVERKNRYLLEITRAIMFSMNVPKYLWGNALLTACYLINRMPSRVLKYETPFQVLKNCFPTSRITMNITFEVFGCVCYVYISNVFRSKLDPKTEKYVFLSYASNKKGYKCFNPITKKFFESMDVYFVEDQPFFQKNSPQGENISEEDNFWDTLPILEESIIVINSDKQVSETIVERVKPSDSTLKLNLPDITLSETGGEVLQRDHNPHLELQVYTRKMFHKCTTIPVVSLVEAQSNLPSEGPTTQSNPSSIPISSLSNDLPNMSSLDLDLPIAVGKGTRACTKHPIAKYLSYEKLSHTHRAYVFRISNLYVPRIVQEALNDSNWRSAIMEKMNALRKNNMWSITNLPKKRRQSYANGCLQ